jgi:ABC-type multidrug transport system fused ATPase/permease subunit
MIFGTLTLGQSQEFCINLFFLFALAAQLGMIITQMSRASATSTSIFEILDVENVLAYKPDVISIPEVEGQVKFDDVTFRYFTSGEPVQRNVDIDQMPGETVALLGSKGSGKSTIINLLTRYYDPSSGSITIHGYDLRDRKTESMRTQIVIVLKEITLFEGKIWENIAYGKPDASDEEVIDAAKLAHAHSFIERLPDGYDNILGERGSALSQGQKQLMATARAALSDPRILILDEATSSVDTRTGRLIQKAMESLLEDRTSFVIVHRLSTIRNADQLLVMDDG